MQKSREAFRTISEVAEWLDVPTHVLRFWESRFAQIKPVKRAGGRRYYRPSDMRIIGGVKTLLHDQGMTIRGVQKLFREQGVKHVSSFAPHLEGEPEEEPNVIEADAVVDTAPKSDAEAPEPAGPARTTREAEPKPVKPLAEATQPEPEKGEPTPEPVAIMDSDESQPDMFPDAIQEEVVDVLEVAEPIPEPVAAVTPEVETAATPDAETESDPLDDSPDFATGPGVAARLALTPRRKLFANRDILAAAADKLAVVRDRAE